MASHPGEAPKVVTWMGRPVDELSRDELLAAVREAMRELEDERRAHRQTLTVWAACREART